MGPVKSKIPTMAPQKHSQVSFSSSLSRKSSMSRPKSGRTSSPVVMTSIPLSGRTLPRLEEPRLIRRSSIQRLPPRKPAYNRFNPDPKNWPEPATVHHLEGKTLSRTQGSNSEPCLQDEPSNESSNKPSNAPSIPPLPSFHPLYPNPHLEACTSGGLTHTLRCGHKVITPKEPEPCARNCSAGSDNPQQHEAVNKTAETFCCTTCVSSLLDKKYAKKYTSFLSEMQGIKDTMGHLPEQLVSQRHEVLQRIWMKERDADWLNLTFYGRRCEPINISVELPDDLGSTLSSETYGPGSSSLSSDGSSLEEGVQLTYQQLLNKPLSASSSRSQSPKKEAKSIDMIDGDDLVWLSADQRFKKLNADILELASRIQENQRAQSGKPASTLSRLLSKSLKRDGPAT